MYELKDTFYGTDNIKDRRSAKAIRAFHYKRECITGK